MKNEGKYIVGTLRRNARAIERAFSRLPLLALILTPPLAATVSSATYGTEIIAALSQPLLVLYSALLLIIISLRGSFSRAFTWSTAIAALSLSASILIRQWPTHTPVPEKIQVVRVLQLNAGHISNVKGAARWIDQQNADLLFVSEGRNLVDDILLNEKFPYKAGHDSHYIMSKHPLSQEAACISGLKTPQAKARNLIISSVKLPSIQIFVASPSVPSPRSHHFWTVAQRDLAASGDTAVELVRKCDRPLIVAGDFNSTPFGRGYRQFQRRSGLINADSSAWRSGTWPANFPRLFRIAIDQIFVSGDIGVLSRFTARNLGGDHLPSIADLAIPQSARE